MSPQYKAFQWLLGDPSLMTYTDARKIQRFALATLYRATNGPGWLQRDGWLNYSVHECSWAFVATPVYWESDAVGIIVNPCAAVVYGNGTRQLEPAGEIYKHLALAISFTGQYPKR